MARFNIVDLIDALSVALGQSQRATNDTFEESESDFNCNLISTCLTVNAKFHECINKLIKKDEENPHSIEGVDVDRSISELDSYIWEAICIMTQPASKSAIARANICTTHRIRRFFSVCNFIYN